MEQKKQQPEPVPQLSGQHPGGKVQPQNQYHNVKKAALGPNTKR